jgi:multiple sugar transport system permease protein
VYPASSTFVYHLYRVAFRDYDFGYAGAFAMVFFVLFLALTSFKLRIGAKWVHYDG